LRDQAKQSERREGTQGGNPGVLPDGTGIDYGSFIVIYILDGIEPSMVPTGLKVNSV
jgi:hypothetical protein